MYVRSQLILFYKCFLCMQRDPREVVTTATTLRNYKAEAELQDLNPGTTQCVCVCVCVKGVLLTPLVCR